MLEVPLIYRQMTEEILKPCKYFWLLIEFKYVLDNFIIMQKPNYIRPTQRISLESS